MKNTKSAFTLVELAIVIVIIGLLVGGVLQGQELIQATKRQAIMNWYTQLEAATHTFKAKYDCLPGDCNKARQLFGTTVTSNGNGDSRIAEQTIAIEHLSLGKMIKGSYMYTNNNSGGGYKPCINTPCPGNERAGFQFSYYGADMPAYFQAYSKRNGNTVVYAGNNDETNGTMVGGIYTPGEAFAFDTKFDDGIPDGGKIFAGGGHRNSTYQTGCVTNGWWGTSAGTYQSQTTVDSCIMVYFID